MNYYQIIFLTLFLIVPITYSQKNLESAKGRTIKDKYRIPDTVIPIEYFLSITLNENGFTESKYSGVVSINFDVKTNESVSEIKLHSRKLTINSVQLKKKDQTLSIDDGPYESDSETDILTIGCKTSLNGAGYNLEIGFDGILSGTDLRGFYKSSYIENGVTKYVAVTDFEPTYARQAFPCFDEPTFKAVFQVSVSYPAGYIALSNTLEEASTRVNGDLQTTTFHLTPKMSTYLVAFSVSEFTCTDGAAVDPNIPTNVCSRPESETIRDWAVTMGPKCLEVMQKFVGFNYNETKLGKMTQLAIPDFEAGAMENWGLVTFRETNILWDKIESSNIDKQRAATVICHEFSHQWFGDLVTLEWWSYIFLNEGFATYFEFYATDEILPEWQLKEQFVIKQLQIAFDADSYETSLPLAYYVSIPLEISDRFDDISYNKELLKVALLKSKPELDFFLIKIYLGGSILRMVQYLMGLDNFKKGLHDYVTSNQFGNSNPDKLWNALNTYVKLPNNLSFPKVMDNWTNKPGYPLLTVTLNDTDIIISQERFLFSNGTSDTKWYVPISYTLSNDSEQFSDTTPRAWLTPDEDLVIPKALDNSEWIILNNQESGYYRINYDDTLWDKISEALTTDLDKIHVLNRAQIVNDLLNFGIVKKIDYSRIFDLLSFLSNDTDYFPWASAFDGFTFLLKRTADEEVSKNLKGLILEMMQNLYDSVPFDQVDDGNQIYTLKQILALTWACNLDYSDCVDNSLKIFEEYKKTGNRPNKNFRSFVYCTALRHSENVEEDWLFLWTQFNSTSLPTEKATILSSLGCTTDTQLLQNYLFDLIASDSEIRIQDASYVYTSVLSNSREGVNVVLDFLTTNFTEIRSYFDNTNSINTFISKLVDRFTKQDQIDQLTNFLENNEIEDDIKTPAQEAIQVALSNLEWIDYFETQMNIYFGNGSSKIASFSIFFSMILVYFIQIMF